jgi:hypothetical protein
LNDPYRIYEREVHRQDVIRQYAQDAFDDRDLVVLCGAQTCRGGQREFGVDEGFEDNQEKRWGGAGKARRQDRDAQVVEQLMQQRERGC